MPPSRLQPMPVRSTVTLPPPCSMVCMLTSSGAIQALHSDYKRLTARPVTGRPNSPSRLEGLSGKRGRVAASASKALRSTCTCRVATEATLPTLASTILGPRRCARATATVQDFSHPRTPAIRATAMARSTRCTATSSSATPAYGVIRLRSPGPAIHRAGPFTRDSIRIRNDLRSGTTRRPPTWPRRTIAAAGRYSRVGLAGALRPHHHRRRRPQVVVVLIDGVGSQEDGGSAYPIPVAHPAGGIAVVSSYCPVDPLGRSAAGRLAWIRGCAAGPSSRYRADRLVGRAVLQIPAAPARHQVA